MKTYFALILLLASLHGRSQTSNDILYKAYNDKSEKELIRFFEKWNKEVPTIAESDFSKLNDTLKQVYQVFTAFYKPTHINKLGGSEWGNNIYKGVDFLIVQNSIKIYFTQKIILDNFLPWSEDTLIDSIMDFRPAVNCGNKQPLYLTKSYDKILNNFLNNEYFGLGTGGIMNPAIAKGESAKRQKFLEKKIKIFYGHWGGYWQLYSYPKVYSITFDHQMHYAKIDFKMVYEGGQAILENLNGYWILISSKRTSIE